jgi:deoxyadenosine/deoxycytidine kinase
LGVSRYIAVEGPIGAGKTALARALADKLGARLCEEPGQNPFLAAFYSDRTRNALQTQLFFLLERYRHQGVIQQGDLFAPGGMVVDYLFDRDGVYAALLLSEQELSLYKKIYDLLAPRVPNPDLVVYLSARPEVLLSRIRKRAAAKDKLVTLEYVEEVSQSYSRFFFQWAKSPLLVVDTSEVDLADDPKQLEELLAIIRRHRGGVQHYIPTLGTRR